ncbi:MAG: hypothetical protein QNK37_02250 [Acidobacteriota bacterium]|nr:hypothetical protein [Acidobacteriota bacterium]
MLEPNLFQVFTDRLNSLGLDYMTTGSVAAMIYGEPRMTFNIDLVLRLKMSNLDAFERAFLLEEFYTPSIQMLRLETRRLVRGHFNLIHHASGFKADIYLEGRDPLHLWAMEKRELFEFMGSKIWVAPPEYVIIRKLEFFEEGGSEKHLRDIESILETTEDLSFEEMENRLTKKAVNVLRDLRENLC